MKKKESNPFKFGKVVADVSFCNRNEERARLKTYINDSTSVWLYSPRRYGKTSLVKTVFNELKGIRYIYFDLYNVTTLNDFCKKYAKVLAHELFDWHENMKLLSEQVAASFKGLKPSLTFDETGAPSFSLQAERIEKQSDVKSILNLPDEISRRSGRKICIAFDEFQEVTRIDPFLTHWMRSAFQHQKDVSYLFLGSKQSLMETLFSSYNSPFYEFGVKVEINPIKKDELFNFITSRFASRDILVDAKIVNDLLVLSECHPHFSQYFASEVFYLIKSGVSQEEEGFTQLWLSKVIESQSHIFQNMYDQLSNIQRRVLMALIQKQPDDGLFSTEYRDRHDLPVSSTLNTTLQSLIKKDLIHHEGSDYKVINPVFKQWLLTLLDES